MDSRFEKGNSFLDWSEIEGKTIDKVDAKECTNVIIITFTDGGRVQIDTEAIGFGLMTPVLYPY